MSASGSGNVSDPTASGAATVTRGVRRCEGSERTMSERRQIAGPRQNPDYTLDDVRNWQSASPEKLNMMIVDGLSLLETWMEDWRGR